MKRKIVTLLLVGCLFLMGSISISYATNDSTIHLKHKSLFIEKGWSRTNKLVGAEGKVTWKTSNSAVARVNSAGTIKGLKYGKCTITAKYDGKTYKCKVKVIHVKPNFDAKIIVVKEKKGKAHVKVRFHNYSGKTLTINRKATYRDYTEPNYAMKLKRDVKIKGHSTKTLDFINYGKYEIWNYAGRQDGDVFAEALESKIFYKFEFDGLTHKGKTYWYCYQDSDWNWYEGYNSVYDKGIPTEKSNR